MLCRACMEGVGYGGDMGSGSIGTSKEHWLRRRESRILKSRAILFLVFFVGKSKTEISTSCSNHRVKKEIIEQCFTHLRTLLIILSGYLEQLSPSLQSCCMKRK